MSYTDERVPAWPEGLPVEGDLLASEAGAAYVIEEVRQSARNPARLKLLCARLEYGSVDMDEEGVWSLYWGRR